MKKTIITVLGKDRVGIIAAICNYLADNNVNILDLNQSIVDGYFNMIMIVDATQASVPFGELSDGIAQLGEQLGMQIKMQQDDIFEAMHRI
ncbi:MAG: ACT domain-containing protein [Lachnospiraceae bacterium]|nr:ACT domain-containing protein [Lachnospiraceae bacterium]